MISVQEIAPYCFTIEDLKVETHQAFLNHYPSKLKKKTFLTPTAGAAAAEDAWPANLTPTACPGNLTRIH